LVIADFHMLDGVSAMNGRWDGVVVHANFPRFSHVFSRMGVPLNQVVWRPYPIHPPHYPEGPAPSACEVIFTGGRHRRELGVLQQAADHLEDVHLIELFSSEEVPARGPLRPQGEVKFPEFVRRLAQSRFAIITLDPSPYHAAGNTVVALAQATGRPLIVSAAGGTVDHCKHGQDALIIPPGEPETLAQAIQRLDNDPQLLSHLAEGAQAAARRASVDRWAAEILGDVDPGPRRAQSGVYTAW